MGDINSTKKSANTSDLILPLGKNWMSFSANSIDHATILPASSCFPNTCLIGKFDYSTIPWPWKYRRSILAVVTTASASLSIFWYLNSVPLNTLLTKYIGFSPSSESWTNTELMALSEIDKYRNRTEPSLGRISIGGLERKVLIWRKASSHYGVVSL